jgi:hypothetical protein
MDTNNNLALLPTDILVQIGKNNSKKELINLSSVNKLLARNLNIIFEMLVPKEFKTMGENYKRIYMHLVDSEEELIERINDFITELKPNINYKFECGFPGFCSSPTVEININNLHNSTEKTACFIFTNIDLIPSAQFKNKYSNSNNEIDFKYFSNENDLSDLDLLLPIAIPGKLLNKMNSVPRLQKIFNEINDYAVKELNDIFHNKLNILDIDFNNIFNSIKSNDLIGIYEFIRNPRILAVFTYINNNETEDSNAIELTNFIKKLFERNLTNNAQKSFQILINIIQSLETYIDSVTDDKSEFEETFHLINSFDIEEFKEVYNRVSKKNKRLNDCILEIDKKFSLTIAEERLFAASSILQNISDYTFNLFQKLYGAYIYDNMKL